MKMSRLVLLPILFCSLLPVTRAAEGDEKAQALAREVWQASGGEAWAKAKELRFTFIVEENGKELAKATHEWNLVAQTDRVQWKGKDVTVDLNNPAATEEAKAAYARWVNDAYWLIAPLKVLDKGVTLKAEGQKESEGVMCETLRLSFAQVGLTPGDQYLLYIDPKTKLVRAWDYMPKPETVMHSTWDKYETFGGVKLSTHHDFAGKVIRFADISVK